MNPESCSVTASSHIYAMFGVSILHLATAAWASSRLHNVLHDLQCKILSPWCYIFLRSGWNRRIINAFAFIYKHTGNLIRNNTQNYWIWISSLLFIRLLFIPLLGRAQFKEAFRQYSTRWSNTVYKGVKPHLYTLLLLGRVKIWLTNIEE